MAGEVAKAAGQRGRGPEIHHNDAHQRHARNPP
jgi:hypothetical protein